MNLFMESNELEHFVYCSEYINVNSVVGQGVGTSLKIPKQWRLLLRKLVTLLKLTAISYG